jgi:hypothetical protein
MTSAEKKPRGKEVNSMNYAKPKIVLSGAAQSVIQSINKVLTGGFDASQSTPEHAVYNMTPKAYEADE